ncbi:MAG: hypothetical protein LBE18_03100 [Planctomycetaceae bacterium]|nr:hypothetical protein [Planctomycetaceae bacterium]
MTRIFFVTLIIAVMLFIGCSDSGKPSDLPELYRCTITITQEGKPLSGAIVEFISEDTNNKKYTPVQHTDSNGTALMSTYGYIGVPAGKYKIIVTKNIEDETTIQNKETGENIIVGGQKYQMVESIYSDIKTTPLEIEVNSKNTKQTFDVGKAVKLAVSG